MPDTEEFPVRVNGTVQTFVGSADTPLLWVLRDALNLTGTKYGCGIGVCGACTVLMDGKAVRSCSLPIAAAVGSIETIEELAVSKAKDLVETWEARNVSQCGYCQPGFIVTACALLEQGERLTGKKIDQEVSNICRCGTYGRIRSAILEVSSRRSVPQ